MATTAERGCGVEAGLPASQCSYRVDPAHLCRAKTVYWLYADDCGCILEGDRCTGHPACEQHAQLARAENRVTSIRLAVLTDGQIPE